MKREDRISNTVRVTALPEGGYTIAAPNMNNSAADEIVAFTTIEEVADWFSYSTGAEGFRYSVR